MNESRSAAAPKFLIGLLVSIAAYLGAYVSIRDPSPPVARYFSPSAAERVTRLYALAFYPARVVHNWFVDPLVLRFRYQRVEAVPPSEEFVLKEQIYGQSTMGDVPPEFLPLHENDIIEMKLKYIMSATTLGVNGTRVISIHKNPRGSPSAPPAPSRP